MSKKSFTSFLVSAFSVLLALVWLIPLVWLVGTALTESTFKMSLFPKSDFTLKNITYVWNAVPFAQYLSLIHI